MAAEWSFDKVASIEFGCAIAFLYEKVKEFL